VSPVIIKQFDFEFVNKEDSKCKKENNLTSWRLR
jgi:hypothetical protein